MKDRRLFDDHMRIGSAHPQSVDGGAPRLGAARPPPGPVHHLKRRFVEFEAAVRTAEIEAGRNQLVAQCQRHLDQPSHTGGRIQMPDVGLDRADAAKAPATTSVGLRQGRDLDRVADRRAGAMRLDIGHAGGVDACHGQRLDRSAGLPVDAGRQVAGLLRAVVVDGRAADHGIDVVAVFDRIGQAPQHHHACAATEDGTLRRFVEGPAMTIGSKDLAFGIVVAAPVRQLDADAAGQRHVAFAGQQALRGHVNCHQRRRAGGLDGNARPFQVQQIRQPSGQKILVVAGVAQQEQAHRLDQLRVCEQVVGQVGLHAATAEDPDGAAEILRHVARVFQRFPGAFEEVAVLRIEHRRVAFAEAEKIGVEHFHVRQHQAGPDIGRVRDVGFRDACRTQLVLVQPLRGFLAITQQRPQLGR